MSAEALAGVISLLPEAVLLVASSGEIRAANARAADMLTSPAAGLAGRNLAELVLEDADTLGAFLRACSRSNALVPAGLTLSGGQRRLACRAEGAVLQPRSGQAPALLFLRLLPKEAAVNRFVALNLRIEQLGKEVARRQRAEADLREQHELLHVTLSSIGDAMIATDEHGRVSFVNPVAEALVGWTQAEALGRPLEEVFVIVNEASRATVESPVAKVLREGVVVGLANHTLLVARDGTERPIDDSGAPIRDAGGRLLGVVLVFRDVTERRELDRRSAEAERRKDEFIAMLAHELRNPLAVLSNGIQAMRMAEAGRAASNGNAALGQMGEAMQRQVRQLARMVDDLLDVSRITTGRILLQLKRVELEAAIRSALETWRPAIAAREIRLRIDLPPEPLFVEADAVRLAQVFGNLLSNAIKFSERGGGIQVAARGEDGQAVVRVVDQGVGIAPEMLRSVFELFVQGDTSLARERGGLGVGLTVASRITELHGGSVEARSGGPGRGAEFVVRLPLAPTPAGPERSEEQAVLAGAAGPRRRILVVDDNADAAASLAVLLRLSGHEVHVAYDAQSALDRAELLRPQVILLDLGLPGIDGYEVVRRLRRAPDTRRALIVAVTGYGTESDRRRAEAAGFDHHLTKPIAADVLEKLIAGAR